MWGCEMEAAERVASNFIFPGALGPGCRHRWGPGSPILVPALLTKGPHPGSVPGAHGL